jgi:murein DD-endopeptidase MepM/ murein hydrolase activator NlpD
MKLFSVLFFCFCSLSTFGQIADSTLAKVFENLNPQQTLKLLQGEKHNEKMREYLMALSFKIPRLNPISNQKVASAFGYRTHPITGEIKKHRGIDLAGKSGQNIYTAADGAITEIGFNQFLGNFVKIKHLLGFETLYGHLQESIVELNSTVYQGQIIGYCGSTGRTTGVHLHFSILFEGVFINPYSFIF